MISTAELPSLKWLSRDYAKSKEKVRERRRDGRKVVGCKYRLVRTRPWVFIWFSCSVTEAISFRALGWRPRGLLKPKKRKHERAIFSKL